MGDKLWAGILFGGHSRRMGRPKQLLQRDGHSLLLHLHGILAPLVDEVVLLGGGQLPDDLPPLEVIPDPPGLAGPLAGLSALQRRAPGVDCLLLGCDLPAVESRAVEWVLAHADREAIAVLPQIPERRGCEPLLAWYGRDSAAKVEELARAGKLQLRLLVGQEGVITPEVPKDLIRCWGNVNRPEDLGDGVGFDL